MAADVAGSAMAHVWFRRLPRGSGRLRGLRSGRCCRPRRALQRPSVSPAASSAGAAAAAAHARAAHCRLGEDGTHHQRAIEETAAGAQRRPPLCRHSGPVGSIRHACAARARLAARLGVGLAGLRVGLDDMRRAGRRAGRGLGAGPGSRSLVSQSNHGEGGEAGVRGMSRGSGGRGGGVGSGSGGVGSGGVYRPTCAWA